MCCSVGRVERRWRGCLTKFGGCTGGTHWLRVFGSNGRQNRQGVSCCNKKERLYYEEGGAQAGLYIPTGKHLRQRILAEHHDAGIAGHLGREKTQQRLERLFWWPDLATHVREYVRTCPSCMMSTPLGGTRQGFLQLLPIPAHAWACMALGWTPHLPGTADGYASLLARVCTPTYLLPPDCF